jgi:hypothetical protein
MAPKRPNIAVEKLTQRVEKLESSLPGERVETLSWFRSLDLSSKIAVIGFPVGILALLVTFFAWKQPQWKAEAEDSLNHKIDDRIEAKLQQHHFDDLASKVSKMEGQLNEISGYLKLLTARDLAQTASLSREDFRKQLPQIKNTLQAATVAEAKVPERMTQTIQSKLLSVPDREPVFWETASALVDYTSALRVSFAPRGTVDCYSTFGMYEPHPPSFNSRRNVMKVDSCTLFIDDVKKFNDSEFGKHFHAEVAAGVTDILILDLTNVHIVYRGGETIPYSALHCENCTYSFEAPIVPPSRGQILIHGALIASNGNLDIPAGI